MKVHLTAAALADLDGILDYTRTHFPTQAAPLEQRLRAVFERIGANPHGARRIGRSAVRVVLLIRYPFKVFYQVQNDRAEVLHIFHAAREEPEF